jgi:hypothetical protein
MDQLGAVRNDAAVVLLAFACHEFTETCGNRLWTSLWKSGALKAKICITAGSWQ